MGDEGEEPNPMGEVNEQGEFEQLDAENANELSQEQIHEKMRSYGLQPSGSHADNVTALQLKFDEDFEKLRAARDEYIEKRRKADAARKKRALLEKQHVEEMEALARDPKLEVWYNSAQDNTTPTDACLRELGPVTCRAVSRVLQHNTSLLTLDVSHSGLDDEAGGHLAEMLKANRRLVKLEAEGNAFSSVACAAFGEALSTNATLSYLSLEGNELSSSPGSTKTSVAGLQALAAMLETNTALTALNLFCTALGADGGRVLADALQRNTSLVVLDVADSGVGALEMRAITGKLEANRAQRELSDSIRREQRLESQRVADERRKQHEAERKARELEEWHSEQSRLRAEGRQEDAEKRRLQKIKDDEAAKAAAEAAALKLAEEEAKGKKKKGKKGKKKK